MISVTAVSGIVTVQDFGRPGFAAIGVNRGGAMDRSSMAHANALVGNPPGCSVLEWALSGGTLQLEEDAVLAFAGAEIEADCEGERCGSGDVLHARAGSSVTVRRFIRGRFAYLAVAGGIDVPVVLGSRATHLSAGFGGHEGRVIRAGDSLATGRVDRASRGSHRSHSLVGGASLVRVIESPDSPALPAESRESFWSDEFIVSPASNRTGYRLSSPDAEPTGTGLMTSEPMCVGSIQITPEGEPVVLMVEGPTVGGYPTIGAVASVDLPLLAQKQPGDIVRFQRIPIEDAQRLLRRSQ